MAKVTLDMETFKALASQTRLDVLRALDERRKTLSELAKELELNKATVHEHLQLLLATGLVRKRDDEGRKWIYYELTWSGERLLHPEDTTTFAILLGLSTAAAGGGIAMLGMALQWWWADRQPQGASEGPPSDDSVDDMAAPESAAQDDADRSGNGTAAQGSSDDSADQGTAGSDGDMAGGEGGAAAGDTEGAFLDDGGWVAIALFTTAVLLMVLAFVVRRTRRSRRT